MFLLLTECNVAMVTKLSNRELILDGRGRVEKGAVGCVLSQFVITVVAICNTCRDL